MVFSYIQDLWFFLKEFVIEYLKDSLTQSEDELRNGSIIGSIVINSYKDKFENFDFKQLEKVLDRSYTHKVAILSLSHVIYDKKIRKKYNSLIKNGVKDAYSSVRKAAAFSEPGFWGLEKKKNQLKKIKSLIKDVKKKKLNKNYLEGVVLGLGINSLGFDAETFEEILHFYSLVQETYAEDETILPSLSYGLSIFCVATRQVEQGLPILFNILESKTKRVRTAIAEALSFLAGIVELNQALDIIKALISHPAHQESWPLNLAILMTYLNHFDSEKKILLLNQVHSLGDSLSHEVLFLLEKNTKF